MIIIPLKNNTQNVTPLVTTTVVEPLVPRTIVVPGQFLISNSSSNQNSLSEVFLNETNSTIQMGTPLTYTGTGVVKASASNISSQCFGFSSEDINQNSSGKVIFSGIISLPNWTNFVGSISLVKNRYYFLSSAAGKLTLVPEESSGNIAQIIGFSISSTKLKININLPILY